MVSVKTAIIILSVVSLLVLAGCEQLLPPGWNATSDTPTGGAVVEVEEEIEEIEEDVTILDEVEEEPVEEVVEEVESTDDSLPRKTVTEGDLVSFPNLQAVDPDGDPITYSFTSPLDTTGKWQTREGDEGEHKVTITASDGKNSVSQVVIIEVLSANKAPLITLASKEIKVKEGETVNLGATAADPDGDEVTLTFSGWMTGQTKATGFNDAGVYDVEVSATDGKKTTKEMVRVIVDNVNRGPSLSPIADVTITEGDKITIEPTATDEDGDDIHFEFGSPIGPDGTWQSTGNDVGNYQITVTATDGSDSDSTSFNLIVESLNKAPTISFADSISTDEGETVNLNPEINDPEGDELTITYSGWMNSNSYTTNYEDAGSHEVTITVSDGINTATHKIAVTVNDINRAPTFGAGAFS